jgi:hypothetical protein
MKYHTVCYSVDVSTDKNLKSLAKAKKLSASAYLRYVIDALWDAHQKKELDKELYECKTLLEIA